MAMSHYLFSMEILLHIEHCETPGSMGGPAGEKCSVGLQVQDCEQHHLKHVFWFLGLIFN